MDASGNRPNMRVSYDETSKKFHSETFLEILKRLEDTRSRSVRTINRSEEAKLDFFRRQVETDRHIFNRMNTHLVKEYHESLMDHIAHMRVLQKIAQERLANGEDVERYGLYGADNVRKFDLLSRIENETKQLLPTARRRRGAFRLLDHRNKSTVFDRNMQRDEFFQQIRSYTSRQTTPKNQDDVNSTHEHTKLILPPICATKNTLSNNEQNSRLCFPDDWDFVTTDNCDINIITDGNTR